LRVIRNYFGVESEGQEVGSGNCGLSGVKGRGGQLRDAQVECQDRARWRKVCSDLQ